MSISYSPLLLFRQARDSFESTTCRPTLWFLSIISPWSFTPRILAKGKKQWTAQHIVSSSIPLPIAVPVVRVLVVDGLLRVRLPCDVQDEHEAVLAPEQEHRVFVEPRAPSVPQLV